MACVAALARPILAQILCLRLLRAANMADLRGRIPGVHLDKDPSVPLGLVCKLTAYLAPTRVGNGFCKVAVAHHILHSQRLGNDHLVFVDQLRCELVGVILALVSDLLMDSSNLALLFAVVAGRFFALASTGLAGEFTLLPSQLLFRLATILHRSK